MGRLALFLLPTLGVSCSCADAHGDENETAERHAVPAFGLSYRAEQGAEPELRLLRWSFDDRPAVPSTSLAPSVPIEWGAAGVAPSTVLYLPLDEGAGETVTGAPATPEVTVEGSAWTDDGRFGAALQLASASARLRARGGGSPLFGARWSLHLWVRPGEAWASRGGLLASAPGVMELSVDDDLRCRLVVALPSPLTLLAEVPLRAGRWNRVSAVYDGPDLRQVRLVVNEAPTGAMRPPGAEAGTSEVLVLGSSGPGRSAFLADVDDVVLEARAATSAECIEGFTAAAPPGEHVLQLAYPTVEKEVRLWSGVLRVPEPRTAEEWSSGELRHFQAGDGGLRWVPGHWERDRPPESPLARTTHPTVYVGDHRAFLFGGETKDSHLFPMVNTSDTWIYHIDEQRWQEVTGGVSPPPRCHQSAAYSPDHGVLFYFGGWRNDGFDDRVYDDVWLYRPDEERWEQRFPGGAPTPRTSDCSVVYLPPARGFLVASSSHVWLYQPEEDRWLRPPAPQVVDEDGGPAELEPGGTGISGFDPETGLVVLFGSEYGQAGSQVYTNRTLVYDYRTNRIVVRHPEPAPSARVRSGFAYDSRRKRFVLFGGVRDQFSKRMDDLWTYRVKENAWVRHATSNTPTPRGGYYGMAYDPDLDVFVVLGGRHSPPRFLSEAWRLHLDSQARASATYVFDRAAFPELDLFHAEWSGPAGTRIALRFGVSADGLRWSDVADLSAIAPGAASRFVRVAVMGEPNEAGEGPRVLALGFALAADHDVEPPPGGGQHLARVPAPR